MDPRLAPYVAAVSGYRFDGLAPGVHVGLPGPHLTVVVSFAEPTVVADPDGEPQGFAALASGLFTAPASIHHDGAMHGLQVDLTPRGARALLGVPAAALDRTVALVDLLDARDRHIVEELHDLPNDRTRTDRVLAALTRRLLREDRPPGRPEALAAWCLARDSRGRLSVGDVARELGWSERHLGLALREEVGLSTKPLLRVARFDHARRQVQAGPPLAEVAHLAGYADQAHLTREWRAFAGSAPTRWLADDALAAAWTG